VVERARRCLGGEAPSATIHADSEEPSPSSWGPNRYDHYLPNIGWIGRGVRIDNSGAIRLTSDALDLYPQEAADLTEVRVFTKPTLAGKTLVVTGRLLQLPGACSRIRSLSRQRLTEVAKLLASCQETHQLWNVKRQRVQSRGRRIPSSSSRASRLEPTSPRHAT